MSPGDAAPGPPPSAAGPPRPALSLRATLLAAAAVAYGLILIVGLALVVRVVPRATGIAARGAGVRADFETRNRVGRSLDVAITDLWDQLRAARTGPIPLDSLEARRLRIEGILRDTELLGPLQSGVVSPEFVGALERADRAAGLMAGTLIGAVGALEIRDVATAERLLRRADTLDAPFTEQLSSVTTAALDELARDELRLEREARYAAGLVTFLVLIGLISAPLLWTLLQERLFRPLRALDAALARVDAGDLAAEVPVDRDDEVGRLGVHFNRTTATLRTQRAAGERAAAEAAIAVSEARFRAAFEQAAVGLAEVALDGHVLYDFVVPGEAGPVVGILWDGAHCGDLLHLAETRELPGVARLIERGSALRGGAVAQFPSITLTNHTSILTGVGPGRHGVMGNVYFDRATGERVVPNDESTWHRSSEWLRDDARTVFEMVADHLAPTGAPRTASIDEAIDRGADFSTMQLIRASGSSRGAGGLGDQLPDAATSPFLGDPAHLADGYFRWGTQVDDLGLQQIRQLFASPGTAPRLTWWANVVTDAGHHGGGPRSSMARDALRQADARLVAFLDHLDGLGVTDQVTFILTADHGFEGSDPAITGSWAPALAALGIPLRDEGPGLIYLG